VAKRKIVITAADRRRLEAMLKSEFAEIVGPRGHLYDLKAELDCATIVRPDDVPQDVVTMNSTIVLRDLDTQEVDTYTLVYPEQADIANSKLSVLAPIGTAVVGQRVGDVLRWRVPAGRRRLKIEQVVYQPEREGAFHL
jgi:regulator of nucleoside diphosphate kinase